MDNKTLGAQAKELVFLFFEKMELKYLNKDIMIAVSKAKNLLKSGYTFDEIKYVIDYCVEHPPEKGIYSFGFIEYKMNEVLALKKTLDKQKEKEKALEKKEFNDYGINISNKNKVKAREVNVDTSIFE